MEFQREIKTAIDLITISIRTAPKSGGVDDVVYLSANNQQRDKIAVEMENIGKIKAKGMADKSVKDSQGLILIGVKGKRPFGANCGGCGFTTCAEFQAQNYSNMEEEDSTLGPFCMFKIWDLGIATDSAAKTASMLNVDNRIMYRIGMAALRINLFGAKLGKKDSVANDISPAEKTYFLTGSISCRQPKHSRIISRKRGKVNTPRFRVGYIPEGYHRRKPVEEEVIDAYAGICYSFPSRKTIVNRGGQDGPDFRNSGERCAYYARRYRQNGQAKKRRSEKTY
jgi:uncharacterized ferredoxin-like protein